VPPSNLRLAAGVGVVAAVMVVGGPTAAVAIADPGGSHSNHSDHRDRADVRGGWKHGGGDRDGGDRDGDRDRDGSDRGDGDYSGGSRKPSTSGSDTAQRSTSGSSRSDTGSTTTTQAPQTSARTSQTATAGEAPEPQTPAGGPGSDTVSGADVARPPSSGPVQPRVTVGNGRSPGIQTHDPEPPRVTFVAPEIAPPPPPVMPPPAPPSTEVSHPQRFVPQFATAPSTNWSDPLWGLAGLVLIPAAGAVLGYRQAKAARDAEVLTRT
jgi:hypothetical protein